MLAVGCADQTIDIVQAVRGMVFGGLGIGLKIKTETVEQMLLCQLLIHSLKIPPHAEDPCLYLHDGEMAHHKA